MPIEDLPANLRLLSGYARSVSDISRRLKINRQQFGRYLAGKTQPSLASLRRICDHFGLDENEIFLEHQKFKELVQLRPAITGGGHDPARQFFDQLVRPQDQEGLQKFAGYYLFYYWPDRKLPFIYRSLARIYSKKGSLMCKQIERVCGDSHNLPEVLKYEGLVFGSADRLIIIDRERRVGRSLWQTILYGSDFEEPNSLTGLMTGIVPDSVHQIISMRVFWQPMGRDPDLRALLRACGRIPVDSPELGDYLKYCVDNEIGPDDEGFTPRF